MSARMEWLVDGDTHEGAQLTLARMTVPAGTTSETHRHVSVDEAVHVLSGRAALVRDDRREALAPGDSAFLRAGEVHGFVNTGAEDCVLMVAYSGGRRDYEAV